MLVQHGRGVRRLWRPGHLLIELMNVLFLGCACSLVLAHKLLEQLRVAGQPSPRAIRDRGTRCPKKRVLPGGGPSYPLPAATYPGRASRCCPQAFAHPDHLRRVPPAARRRRYAHVAPARPRPLELTSQISRRVLWPPRHSLWMLCSRSRPDAHHRFWRPVGRTGCDQSCAVPSLSWLPYGGSILASRC